MTVYKTKKRKPKECAIVFVAHTMNSAIQQNLDALRYWNRYAHIFPVWTGHEDRCPDGFVSARFFGEFMGHWVHATKNGTNGTAGAHASDMVFFSAFAYYCQTVKAPRWIMMECDGFVTGPMRQIYKGVWNADVAAATVRLPETDPGWSWFHDNRLPELLKESRCGLVPLCGIMYSRRAISNVAVFIANNEYAIPWTLPANAELRHGSLARKCGYDPVEVPSMKDTVRVAGDYCLEDLEPDRLYHPMKCLHK
jgi:hypothetical protein